MVSAARRREPAASGSAIAVLRRRRRRQEGMQRAFELLVLAVCVVLFVFPFLNLAAVSISSSRAVLSGEVYLAPREPQFEAWLSVLQDESMVHAFFVSVVLTAVYTVVATGLLMLAAYPLSRGGFRGRTGAMAFFLVTMYFSGGLIPSYLILNGLGMLDTFSVLVLPGCFSVYNMLILRTFFRGVPDSLEESAKIDGASDFTVLTRIYLPLCVPALATLALFAAVSRWNQFQDALFFLPSRRDLAPLQLVLQRLLAAAANKENAEEKLRLLGRQVKVVKETQKAANILFTVIPIICVYPWVQRYFVKGVMIGSIKG
jgi:putative aldouronate transport system permease protein